MKIKLTPANIMSIFNDHTMLTPLNATIEILPDQIITEKTNFNMWVEVCLEIYKKDGVGGPFINAFAQALDSIGYDADLAYNKIVGGGE